MKSKTRFAVAIMFSAGLMVSCSTGTVASGGRGRAREEGPDVKTGME